MRTPRIPAVTALALCSLVACNKPEAQQKPTAAIAAKTPEAPAKIDGKLADNTADKAEPTPLPGALPTLPTGPVTVASPDKLIPADATLLAHVDLQGLGNSPLWTANRSLMDADPEVKKQLDALTTCNMPMSGFRALDLGVDADGINVAAVVTGAGIGKAANLTCMQDQLKGDNFRLEERGGARIMVLEGGDAFGFLVNDDTLAFVSKGWDVAVRNLINGTGASVRDGGLQDVLAKTDQSKHVWFAGTVSPQLTALTDAIPGGMSGLKSIAGSLDLTTGLALVMSFGMENADRASATLAQIQKQFAGVKPMAGIIGLPAAAVDRVQFDTKDTAVTMTASLNMDEINAMRAAAEKSRTIPGPGSKGSGMPTVGGDSAPTGAAPSPSSSGRPASDPPPAPATPNK